ncbi:MAG: hypothetical protein IKO99_04315 [Bacteroidales bacterium]|nr:hypothetical protein [Bacteroidales bacterium]
MIQIANPIYDSVFKYMMQNRKVCMILLGALLNVEIVEVDLIHNELVCANLKGFGILRLDFLAKIKKDDGSFEMVSIEVQKAEKDTEIVRFRRYLSRLYDTEAYETKTVKKKNRKGEDVEEIIETPIHIVAIYFLGHPLDDVTEPVVYYSPKATNALGEPVEKAALNPFFRYLSHDSVVVQIPYLRKNARTKVEEFLEIFDQSNVMPNDAHYLMLDNLDNKPDGYNIVVRQLVSAVADREIKMAMAIEDEYASDIEDRTELEEIVEEQKEKLAEKDAQLSQKDAQLSAFAKTLFSMGLSREEISEKINIPLEQLNKLLD